MLSHKCGAVMRFVNGFHKGAKGESKYVSLMGAWG
jgi:hypothetical protein